MNMKLHKNIYIIDEYMSSKQNGIGTYMRQLIICLRSVRPDIIALVSFNTECRYFSIRRRNGIVCYDFPYFAEGAFVDLGGLAIPVLRQYVEDKKENVFFMNHSPCAGFLKTLRALFPKSKIVFTIHDQGWTAPLLGNADYLKALADSKYFVKIKESSLRRIVNKETIKFVRKYFKDEQRMYKAVDAVICLSPNTQNLVETVYAIPTSKLHVIPNGIDPANVESNTINKAKARKDLNLSYTEKVFLFVGRAVKAKGIIALLKAFEHVSYQHPECRLVIVGECLQMNEFAGLAPHACTRITYTGLVSKDELAQWYIAADFGVLPSYTEQCSYTGIEMMAYGLPVITTDGNGLADMFTDGVNAVVAPIGNVADVDSFVENTIIAIERDLRLSDEEKQDYIQKGLELVRTKYSAKRMRELYYYLLSNI